MTAAGTVLLVLAALTATAAWSRRLPLRARTALVLGAVLLLLAAFVLAAAAPDEAGRLRRLGVRVPLDAPQALGWLLVAWLAAAGGGPVAEVVLRLADGRRFWAALRGVRRAPRDGAATPPAAAPAAGPAPEVVVDPREPPRPRQVIRPGGLARARQSALVEEAARAHEVSRALEAGQDAAAQVLRGGAVIGVLERLAVAGALLAGAAEGVALVVAVKALGRYPELRAAGASERFIIGTLASLLWAAAAAGTGLLLLG
ncbi:hypothetical protein [Quadrisphaera sp. DSM 44207]|uniref:hypothetical protein n=1 Tax=Quadrisphaera sp. DSM 44207 TaxID=1881057 RepID=UPI000880371C|nr:hypothetical protein [Quadrisphaera sp. DSM 44207]SDQ46402.1 hypothetical protein SAMN05428996_1805 [Quadrisphaera sp. DSM 44207]